MSDRKQPIGPDLLGLASIGAIASLVTILCYAAASYPDARRLLSLVIIGLGAGGLILFRQLRKGHSDLITREARAQYMARHDDLTQLPNKTLFLERLSDAASNGSGGWNTAALGVMCVGLDRFYEVTELLGYAASDNVVAETAQRLAEICGRDQTLARLGDDLFAIIWTGASRDDARGLAERLIARLAEPYLAAEGQTSATASVGISFLTPELGHPIEALRHAQMALTTAQKNGGARHTFYQPEMDQALRRRKALEVELRRAVAEDALRLMYQPQVNAKGQMVGVEALMRWTSVTSGDVSPATFVPLAESCGLSDAIGRFALRQAFEDSRNWQGLKVAINVSAPHVRSGSLVPTLKELLAETGLNARAFELEITESVLLTDEPETYDTLHAIRRLGFSIALDDFGTGYSSLSYLRRFPVDKIKIDRAFIMQIGKRPESSAIIKAMVELAEALDLKVIAEGVETREQVERLAEIGSMHYQGFLFSQPVPAATIDDLLARRASLAA